MAENKTLKMQISSAALEITLAYKKEEVNTCIQSKPVVRKMKKFGGALDSRHFFLLEGQGNSSSHFCNLSGKSILVCDVEVMKDLPPKLKHLLSKSKVHGQKIAVQRKKMALQNVPFGVVADVKKKFKKPVIDPEIIKDRKAAKSTSKGTKFSEWALLVAAAEAFGCFIHAKLF